MEDNRSMIKTEICIVGAGPAGLSAALNLAKQNIDFVIIDKSQFPRDKVCGECFDANAFYVLKRLGEDYLQEMVDTKIVTKTWDTHIADENGRSVRLELGYESTPRIISKRTDFDTFLLNKLKTYPTAKIYENTSIHSVEKVEDGIILKDKTGEFVVKTKLLISASGATSKFATNITEIPKPTGEYYTYVRAYYENVAGLANDVVNVTNFYAPNMTLYICPLPNGMFSVELGIKQKQAKKYKINLRKKLPELIASHEKLKRQFENARIVGKIKGASIQLSYKNRKLSFDRVLLAGAVSQSVNPLSGFGVGHAMVGGEFAAKTAIQAIKQQDFSARFLGSYDKAYYKKLGLDMISSRIMTIIFDYPKILLPVAMSLGKLLMKMFLPVRKEKKLVKEAFLELKSAARENRDVPLEKEESKKQFLNSH
jgi:flavin-dependent dehydrogenase